MLGVLMLVWSVLIWPFVVKISIVSGNESMLSGCIRINTIGIGTSINWKLVVSEKGVEFDLLGNRKNTKDRKIENMGNAGRRMRSVLRSSPSLRRDLQKYLLNTQFIANVRLGLNDAAATALCCAALSALLGCYPRAKGYITPDFRCECFNLNIRCIAAIRLGRLFVSAALGAGAFALRLVRQKVGGAANG